MQLQTLIALAAAVAGPPTAAAEIERILRQLASDDHGRHVSRNGALMRCLFGIQRPSAASLSDAGRLFAMPRQQVRQIRARYRRLAATRHVHSAQLTGLHDTVRTSSVVTRDALEQRLGSTLGVGPTLEQVLAFCKYILDLPDLRSTLAARVHFALPRSRLFFAEPRHVDALRAVMQAARRAAVSQCVVSVDALLGSLQEHLADLSTPQLAAVIRTGLTQTRDFHWLDEEDGLFFLHRAASRDPVLRAAQQIIAVAQRVPDPESLVTGIERTHWWRYALPPDAPIRSTPILLAYLRARGAFERHPPRLTADQHLALLRRTLGGAEFAVYRVLSDLRWATRQQVVMAAAPSAERKSAALHAALCHAPWIEHPCRGRYAIVGSSQRSSAEAATLAQSPQ